MENPWGLALDGTFAMIILKEEFLHHRGQLYAYVRACGAEPPFLSGFGNNPDGFLRRSAATPQEPERSPTPQGAGLNAPP